MKKGVDKSEGVCYNIKAVPREGIKNIEKYFAKPLDKANLV